MLNVVVAAVRKAGEVLTTAERHRSSNPPALSARQEFLDEVSGLVCDFLLQPLLKTYPQHVFYVNDELKSAGDYADDVEQAEHVWHITPIDGTDNFLHGLPNYAIVVSYTAYARPKLAVVFDPVHNDLYVAQQGSGVLKNDKKQRVSQALDKSTETALLNTPIVCATEITDGTTALSYLDLQKASTLLGEQIPAAWRYRSTGSAYLSICALAGGQLQWACVSLNDKKMPSAMRLILMESGASFLHLPDTSVWCAAEGNAIEDLVKKVNRLNQIPGLASKNSTKN
jgi:fructose-1,6-bisphosphatase/inositol monophosphatase family enzyme